MADCSSPLPVAAARRLGTTNPSSARACPHGSNLVILLLQENITCYAIPPEVVEVWYKLFFHVAILGLFGHFWYSDS